MKTWRRVFLEMVATGVAMVVAGALVAVVGLLGFNAGYETGFRQGGFEYKRDLEQARIDAERATHELKYVRRERDQALFQAAKARSGGYTPKINPKLLESRAKRDTTKGS